MKIIYIHGYQGSSQSNKAKLLKKWFGEEKVIAPDIRYESSYIFQAYLELENRIRALKNDNEKLLVIGSSFGGYMAFNLFKRFKNKTLLINPSLSPSLLLAHTGIDTSEIEKHTQNCDILSPLAVWLSNDDELLGETFFHILKNKYPTFNYTHFENSGHRFTAFENCRERIEELINSMGVI